MKEKSDAYRARVLAFYLPQFHPIPENDRWWGNGFTEWTNVGKARRLYPGHDQPRVPADLGYYDLRVPESRKAQADLARAHGVEGFVYWHYWFGNGKRLLERPFNEVLASGSPDFPFALAWANETWSGTFHGLKKGGTLIDQTYPGDDDYAAHFNAILPAFMDPRYLTCDGKPMFFVYKPLQLPDMAHFIGCWRRLAKENGLPGICFVAIGQALFSDWACGRYYRQMKDAGFDLVNVVNVWEGSSYRRFAKRALAFLHRRGVLPDIRPYAPEIFDSAIDAYEDVIPSVAPMWDHTPRSGIRGVVLHGSTPEKFEEAVRRMLKRIESKPPEHRFLMVKSWNEWAEGNYLEPDLRWGRRYLEALRSALT